MQVPYGEGLATHTGPESCVYSRKVIGEALTGGVRAGLLSHERTCKLQGADTVLKVEGNTGCSDIARYRLGLAWSETPGTYTSSLHGNREVPRLAWADGAQGLRCESQGSTTAMNGCGKSDRPIVPEKRRTKAGETPAGGGGGGKWPDRGESVPTKQVLGTEPGKERF
jgi:RNA-directed DNA polymerase